MAQRVERLALSCLALLLGAAGAVEISVARTERRQ